MRYSGTNKVSKSIKKQLVFNIVSFVIFAIILVAAVFAYIGFKYANNTLGAVEIIAAASIAVILIVLSYIFTGSLSKRIINPLSMLTKRLDALSEGDMHTEVEMRDMDDEIGQLSKAVNNILTELNSMISEMTHSLVSIDEGDFTVTIEKKYPGDFESIGEAIKRINMRLNRLMGRIIESSEQLATGADQVADNAQSLSQGTTEQASSIQELAATINELSEQTNQNARNAETAKLSSGETSVEVENGNRHMNNMVRAMDEIKETSVEISKIIKTIDDIAFQTNILALNAAVEAARAGSAGKGFAVVADEVRNLASKSAEAAKNTTHLIERSLSAVENGSKIVSETEESLKSIVDKVKITVELVEQISEASAQQAVGTSQVSAGIEQISGVVQTNSATSEESAAASEELSGLAQGLKGLVDGIKLKKIENYDID
ncbi:HAMP domain-containing methyl-accepting chemotaxis protein [Sedimentibacter sp.]|uniref:methyl-accepting chemotaxis protein n=1 Tax=Sedimentibacter sp. TaxID=1960295 RepID=UPI00289B6649|nr:HAMP domain-containing methyl-accepting chemotaxis protein [Sedimentibacter sp.]